MGSSNLNSLNICGIWLSQILTFLGLKKLGDLMISYSCYTGPNDGKPYCLYDHEITYHQIMSVLLRTRPNMSSIIFTQLYSLFHQFYFYTFYLLILCHSQYFIFLTHPHNIIYIIIIILYILN